MCYTIYNSASAQIIYCVYPLPSITASYSIGIIEVNKTKGKSGEAGIGGED